MDDDDGFIDDGFIDDDDAVRIGNETVVVSCREKSGVLCLLSFKVRTLMA